MENMKTKKRFTLEMQYWKGNPQGRKLFDNLTGQDGMSVEELCNVASALHCKCEELESVLEVYEDSLDKLEDENKELKAENEQLKQFKENVIKWVDSQMKFNAKKYIETEDCNFKSENIDLHNFKVFIGIDSDD